MKNTTKVALLIILSLYSEINASERHHTYGYHGFFEVGKSLQHFDYRERLEKDARELYNTEVSKLGIDGYYLKGGLKISWDKGLFDGANYITALYKHESGDTDYVGGYIGGAGFGSLQSKSDNTIDIYELMYLNTSDASRDYTAWLGIGLGYREWERKLTSYQIETYKWKYFKALIGIDYDLLGRYLNIGIEAAFFVALEPTMDLQLNTYSDELTLDGTMGLELRIPLTVSITDSVKWETSTTFQHIHINRGELNEIGFLEPESLSANILIDTGLRCQF